MNVRQHITSNFKRMTMALVRFPSLLIRAVRNAILIGKFFL